MKRSLTILWYIVTLRCEEADRVRCLNARDRTWYQRWAERMHRIGCSSCRSARRQLDVISETIDAGRQKLGIGSSDQLSDDARRAMIERLRAEQKNI
jgi:hypothetical protein